MRALAVVLILAASLVGAYRAVNADGSDFEGFWRAGRSVWDTGELPQGKAERYPPSFVVSMTPLGALPIALAAAIWTALNVAALFLTPRALERLGGSSFDEQWPAWIAVGPILLDNLVLGQSGPLLLYLATVGLAWAREGRLSGLPLGIAALLKVLPIAFLVLPLSLGRARGALIGLAACLGVAGAGCALALGTGPVIAEARGWVTEVSVRQTPSGLLAAGRSLRFNNQGLAVTLARTLGDIDPARAKGAVRLASLPLAVPLRIAQGIVAAMILVGAVALWRARRDPTPTTWLGLYGMIATGMLASAPLVWTHYFLWQFPALAFLARRRRGLVWTVGVVSAACLAWQPARALGAHMALSILLYAIVARDVLAGE